MICHRQLLIVAALPAMLAGSAGSQPAPPAQSVAKEKREAEPDPAAIAKLVVGLGSPKFAEREQAGRELETIGVPALAALRTGATSPDSEVARRAKDLIEVIENSPGGLLALYRDYGLPLPPDDARLVRFESGGGSIHNGKRMPPTYYLGFLLHPGAKDKQPLLLVGTQEFRLRFSKTPELVDAKAELVDGLNLEYRVNVDFEANDGLALALQFRARGWEALAQRLWATSLKQGSGHPRGGFYQPANLPNRTAVAYLAWAYSANELVQPGTDRAQTAKRMKAVLAAEPKLDSKGARELLQSVEASLVPSKAKPGSVERLIDDLTEMGNAAMKDDEDDPRYARLSRLGFDAVPALLEHLDDIRLTRSVQRGFNNFPAQHIEIRQAVSDLLQDLAGDDVGKDWVRRQQGAAVDKADAKAWWEKAQKEGEETYLISRVLAPGAGTSWPRTVMLEIVARKYPQHLPKLYQTILTDRPNIQSWPIAKAIAESSLPDAQKRTVFLDAAENKSLLHRRSALDHLQKLDPDKFVTLLLATLEALPRTPTEPYWSCPEKSYAHVVLATDDARVWKKFEAVAKRSDVGLRMEFLNPMNYTRLGDRLRSQRPAFLAAFLDDAEAPDVAANPKMFEGPHAGFSFKRLEVRDLAAEKMASILDLPDRPDMNWTPDQWKALRQQVKDKLKK